MTATAQATSHLHLELPVGLHDEVKEQADKEGRSVAEVTRRALRVRLGQPEDGIGS